MSLDKRYASHKKKQKGQIVLNRSPDVSSKLIYRCLLKAGHFTGDIWGHYLNKLGRNLLGEATYQISMF